MQGDLKEQKDQIKSIENNAITIDKKFDLLEQKVDLELNNNR